MLLRKVRYIFPGVLLIVLILLMWHNREDQKTIETFLALLSMLIVAIIVWWDTKKKIEIIKTCITIIFGIIIILAVRLQPEKHEIRFPFVSFYDWENGEQIDLNSFGHYYIEIFTTMFCKDMLKKQLKDHSDKVTADLSEYVLLTWLSKTPFGYEHYFNTIRFSHIGFMNFAGQGWANPRWKSKVISVAEQKHLMKSNLFSTIINNHPIQLFGLGEIKIPPDAKFEIFKDNNDFTIKISKRFWFEVTIHVTMIGGCILTNRTWAKQYLNLRKGTLKRLDDNKIYNCIGLMEIKWNLERWYIGNPDMVAYRVWLSALTERLQIYYDWDKISEMLHIETVPRSAK
jgi:hypothetical protein